MRRALRGKHIWIAAGSIVIVLGIIAAFVTSGGTASKVSQTGSVSISGAALPDYSPTGKDPAIGKPIPSVSGTDFNGKTVRISPSSSTIILFLAHWCPHCRKEVPIIQSWLDQNGMPSHPKIVSVSTGVNPAAPNYPPSDWLAAEHWSVPVIRDDAQSSVSRAFGVTGYPAFVIVKAGAGVVVRASGEISISKFESWVRSL